MKMFPVYVIRDYEVLWTMGTAVVAASSPDAAEKLLQDSLRMHRKPFKEIDIHFRIRGGVIETGYSMDREGVVYDSSHHYLTFRAGSPAENPKKV